MSKVRSRYDVVLVIPNLLSGLADSTLLTTLTDCFRCTNIIGCDIYYRRDTNIALVVVHIDIHVVTATLLHRLHKLLERSGVSMLEPAKMSASDRDRFQSIYLPNQDLKLKGLPTPEDALGVLGERLGCTMPQASPSQSGDRILPPRIRFRRGDLWHPGRLCRITDEGIYIATGGPPRLGDLAEVEITTRSGTFEGSVVALQVTPSSAARALGVGGFGGRFQFKNSAHRRTSAPILQAAQAETRRMSAPPKRRDMRIPLRWPAFLASGTGTRRIHVRDVSTRGLLVEVSESVADTCELLVPSDDRESPMRLRTRVARTVSHNRRGADITWGVGVELLVPDDEDGMRFSSFVRRVQKRARTRIVIGAAPQRLDRLLTEFSAAGYQVAGAGGARNIFERAVETRDPPDLIVVDSSLRDGNIGAARSLQRALDHRGFQTLRLDGDEPAPTRHLIDAALVA